MNNINVKFSRRVKELLTKILFQSATLEEVASCVPAEMAHLAIYCRAECHLLWRLRQFFPDNRHVPPSAKELLDFLHAGCLRNAAINLKHDQVAKEVCGQLVGAGLEVMLLKGTSLRARYPILAGRPQCDTDIMVHTHDVEKAELLMSGMGFRVDEKCFTRDEYLAKHFDLRMIRDQVPVEIHWTMSNECAQGGVERTWERAEKVNWQGLDVFLPSYEDEAVFSLVHICRHDFLLSLKWFGDFLVTAEYDPGLRKKIELVAGDWPSRMIEGPIAVATSFGLPPEEFGSPQLGIDGALLKCLARAAVFFDAWFAIPQYRFGGALKDWTSNDKKTLYACLVNGLTKRAVHKV